MTITRRRTCGPRTVQRSNWDNFMNELFNNGFGDRPVREEKVRYSNPAVNLREYDERFVLELALPGLEKEDVTIKIEDDLLKLSGKASANGQEEKGHYRRQEFDYRNFRKNFRLPDSVDTSKIEASFKSGILTVVLNKREEFIPKPPRNIDIL